MADTPSRPSDPAYTSSGSGANPPSNSAGGARKLSGSPSKAPKVGAGGGAGVGGGVGGEGRDLDEFLAERF